MCERELLAEYLALKHCQTPYITSAVGMGPSPTCQSNITRVKQTIIICKHNTIKYYNNYVLCLYHSSFVWV